MDKEETKETPKKEMTKTTTEDAARIQAAYAKEHDGKVDKGSFPARAQAAAEKNEAKKN